MHISFLKKCGISKKSLFTILGAFLCIVLASCNNFLKGAETKKQLEDSIAYANAKACTLYLKSNPAMGSFLAEGGVTCKVGYSTELQFTLKKDDYYFVSLEALSTTDESQSRADCVEFTLNEKKSDLERGVYVISTKLLKAADDILIQPKCLEIPYIKQYSPSETRVQYANTPIVITFNMPVEDDAVSQAESVFNYDNIKLSAANIDYSYYTDSFNGDMRNYFYPPEFNSQKTLLTLTPKGELLKKFIADLQFDLKLSFLEINVSFTNITVEQEELTFSLKEGTVSDFVIRYNSETEETAPDKKEFFIAKEKRTLADAALVSDENKYEQVSLTKTFKQEDYNKKLLAPSTLYIYGKYYDEESGVASIEVTEYLEASTIALSSTREKIITSFSIKEKNNYVEFYEDGTGYTSFVIKYDIQENLKPSPISGIISLTVLVKDLCGNCSEPIRVAVLNMEYQDKINYTARDKRTNTYFRDTTNDYLLHTPFDVCNAPFSKVESAAGTYDFAKYNSDIKTIRIKDEYKPSIFSLYGNVPSIKITDNKYIGYIIYSNEVDYECEYIDRYGNKRRESFPPYNPDLMERTFVLDLDSVAGKSFYVIPMYKGSPIGRVKFTFPDIPSFNSINQTTINVADAVSEVLVTKKNLALCKYPDGSYKMVFMSNSSLTKSTIPEDCSCYFVYARLNGQDQTFPNVKYVFNTEQQRYIVDNTYTASELDGSFSQTKQWFDRGLLSEILGPYSKTQPAESAPATPETSFYKSRGSDGYINVTLQWASDLWDNYDSLVCQLDKTLVTLRRTDTFTQDGKVCYTIPVESEKFFSVSSSSVEDRTIAYMCKGTKNNIISSTEITAVSLSDQEKSKVDNIKPSHLYYYNGVCINRNAYCEFLFYDYGSGPQTGKIWINNNTTPKFMTQRQGKVNCYGIQISAKDFVWGDNTIKYELQDKNGNTTEGRLSFYLPSNTNLTHIMLSNIQVTDNNLTATPYVHYKSNVNLGNGSLYVYGYKSSSGWDPTPIVTFDKSNPINNDSISVPLSDYTFVNVFYASKSNFDSTIYYAGSFEADGNYNYVIPNGTKNDSVVICSNNDKVLVRVYSVSDTGPNKDLCQKWNEDKWELFGDLESQDEQIFTVTPQTPTVYTTDRLKNKFTGKYYCVVAHFANGDCVASPVMHR